MSIWWLARFAGICYLSISVSTCFGKLTENERRASAFLGDGTLSAAPKSSLSEGGYRLGNIDGVKLRIPEEVVLSTVTSDPDSAWKISNAETNTFARPIRYFDLKLSKVLPGSPDILPVQASLTTRGFLEASVSLVTKSVSAKSAFSFISADLAGQGAAAPYVRSAEVAGFRHWKLLFAPNEPAIDTDLLLDERAGLAIKCMGGALFMSRSRGICAESFFLPKYHLKVDVSFSGADLADARIVKDHVIKTINSFVVK